MFDVQLYAEMFLNGGELVLSKSVIKIACRKLWTFNFHQLHTQSGIRTYISATVEDLRMRPDKLQLTL